MSTTQNASRQKGTRATRATHFSLGSLIHSDLAALERHVLGRLDVDLPRAVHLDVLALDENAAVLLHHDAGGAGRERDLVAGGDCQHLADRQVVVLADRVAATLPDRHRLVLADAFRAVLADAD